MNTQTFELTTTDWEKIEFNDDSGFSFWVDTEMSFSEIPSPTAEQQIAIPADTRFMYKRGQIFYVKGEIGNKIFLSPFER